MGQNGANSPTWKYGDPIKGKMTVSKPPIGTEKAPDVQSVHDKQPKGLQQCGCYDGPFSRERPTPVSLRCNQHLDTPRPGASVPLVRDAEGNLRLANNGQIVPL